MHELTIHLGKTGTDAKIAIDGQDITRACRALSLESRARGLTMATLEMFASKIETLDLPADITILPVKIIEQPRPPISVSEALALLGDEGYSCVRLAPGQRPCVIDAVDEDDQQRLTARLEGIKREGA